MTELDIAATVSTAEAIDALASTLDGDDIAIPRAGLLDGLAEERYHADPCEEPSLSSSIAHTLISQSPAHAYLRHPRLGGWPRPGTTATREGSALHALLLEGADVAAVTRALIGQRFEVVPFKDFRTKAAKERRDRLALAGVTAMTQAQYDAARIEAGAFAAVAERIGEQLEAHGVELGPGDGRRCEVSAFWRVETPHGEIQCRGRFDQLEVLETAGLIVVTDLKRIRSADPRQCEKHCENYGYATQRAAYVDALETLYPDYIGRIEYRWLFVETEEPYVVTPAEPDGELRELGAMRWHRACETWARCMTTGEWPGYVRPGEVARLGALPWARREGLEGAA